MDRRAVVLLICALFISIIEGLSNDKKNEELKRGLWGEDGQRGWKGSKGEKGFAGYIGLPGDKGEPGEKGEKGGAGHVGIVGLPGRPGHKGDKGNNALPECKGDKGEMGDDGISLTGPPGFDGRPGLKGSQGLPGPRGDLGWIGFSGMPGPRGAIGQKGKVGPPGPPGICNKEEKLQSDYLSPTNDAGWCVNLPKICIDFIRYRDTEEDVPCGGYATDVMKMINYNDTQPYWLSSKVDIINNLYGMNHKQISLMQIGYLTIRFYCRNSNPVGTNAVTLLSWNGVTVGHKSSATSRFHYSVENDGCSVAKENTWSSTDITMSSPFYQLPIVDIFIRDVNSVDTPAINKSLIVEIVNLCFK